MELFHVDFNKRHLGGNMKNLEEIDELTSYRYINIKNTGLNDVLAFLSVHVSVKMYSTCCNRATTSLFRGLLHHNTTPASFQSIRTFHRIPKHIVTKRDAFWLRVTRVRPGTKVGDDIMHKYMHEVHKWKSAIMYFGVTSLIVGIMVAMKYWYLPILAERKAERKRIEESRDTGYRLI